jgi:hypothetical protein
VVAVAADCSVSLKLLIDPLAIIVRKISQNSTSNVCWEQIRMRSALLGLALLSFAATPMVLPEHSAYAATMNYVGTWSNAKVYAAGSVVEFKKGTYYSLKSSKAAPNKNNAPDASPDWWQPLGGPSVNVVDATGKFVGTLVDPDAIWFNTPDGKIMLRGLSAFGFFYPQAMYYESADCSGQAYMDRPNDNVSTGIVSVGAVRKANGALDQGNTSVAGTLYYPVEPFAQRQIGSILGPDGTCEVTSDSAWVGPVSSLPVSWSYPLKLGN